MAADASVFVSYRRDDSKHAAGRLGERLHERFRLFMDIDNIRPGTDFTAVVREAVDEADVVLAIIGTHWLAATGEIGTRRIDDPEDWVALEVGTALRRGTPVIPVLVDGARMPDRGELPTSLAELASRQAISLNHESFGADCTRLIETIDLIVGADEAVEVDLWSDPDYPAARSALLQGQWAKAAEGLERVLRRHPRHPQVQDQLAEAQRRQNLSALDVRARDAAAEGRWGVAVEALEAIEALQPSAEVSERLAEARRQQQVRSLQQDVRALAQLGDWAAVVAADAELAALDPRSADFEGLATRAHEQLLEAGLETDYRRGLQQLDAGEWEAGEATFASILGLRPGYRDCDQLLEVARRRGVPEEPAVKEYDTQPVAAVVAPVEERVEVRVEEPVAEAPPPPPVAVARPTAPPPPTPPPETVRPDAAPPAGRRIPRAAWIAAAAVVIVVGALVTGVVLTGDDDAGSGGSGSDPSAGTTTGPSGGSTTDVPQAAPPPATGDELVPAPELTPERVDGTIAMASQSGGVRIDRLSEVEQFGTGDDARSRPDGGQLRAFHLKNFPCEAKKCEEWSALGLEVVVGDDARVLPDGPGTYVVAIPAGAANADLVMTVDGVTQRLSLLTGEPSPDNIAVLVRPNRSTKIDEHFRLTETTSIPIDYGDGVGRTSAVRDVTVGSARLGFFVGGLKPSSPQGAFLVVEATYTRPYGDPERHVVKSEDMRFRADDGTIYTAIDVEDQVEGADGVFEVPGDVTGGTLLLGGHPRPAEAGDGTPYQVTLEAHPVRFQFS